MSQHAVELCSLLVDEIYGELTSRIFTILQRRGRLTIKLLQEHTQLNQRQLRHGLAVLIQQNLLYHFYEKESKETYYEANQDAAYWLLRSGKIMEIAEEKFGPVGLELVRDLHLLGQAKVSTLVNECEEEKSGANGKKNGTHAVNGLNGDSNGHSVSRVKQHTIARLVEAGMVQPVKKSMFRSPADTRNEIEKGLLKERYGGSTKGTKQKEELNVSIRAELEALRSDEMQWKPKGKKRAPLGEAGRINGSTKRRRLSHSEHAVNGNHHTKYEDDSAVLDGDLLLRINYEKFAVTLRNARLVELASDRIGETTSQVYAELLRLLEDGIPRCRLDPKIDDIHDLLDGPSLTTFELSAAISDTINVAQGIGKVRPGIFNQSPKIDIVTKRKSVEVDPEAEVEGDEEEAEDEDHEVNGNGNIPEVVEDSDSHGDDPFTERPAPKSAKRAKVTFEEKPASRAEQLEKHLMLLEADECKFIRRCAPHQWTVDFEDLVDHLKESGVNSIMLENFGQLGHRLVRMMRKFGKVDEKILPQTALTGQKEIRCKLAEMQMAGMVEVQCIPRDAAHTVQRSIFLWFFDADRVLAILLNNIYKAMARCLQRLEVERQKDSSILSLAARSDVRESEKEVLTGEQLNHLQNFRDKEEMLVGQLGRLDELVAIFRDY